jgi:peptidoglycan/LPS O-acetylase OafA/YrhL
MCEYSTRNWQSSRIEINPPASNCVLSYLKNAIFLIKQNPTHNKYVIIRLYILFIFNLMQKNNFNLIRFILASLVIFCHNIEFLDGNRNNELLTKLFGTLSFGEFSVSCFFILSGYLIVKSWDRNSDAKIFLANRVLRIYPGFIVASTISCFLIGPFAGNPNYFNQFNYANFFKNLLFLQIPDVKNVFVNSNLAHVNGSLWSIKHEFICYMLVLFLGILSFIKNKKGWILFFLILFSATSFAFYYDLKNITDFLSLKFRMMLIFTFAIGGSYYLFGRPYLNKKPLYIVTGILMLICFFNEDVVEVALAIFGGYLILSFAESTVPMLSNFNKLPDISYGIYLYGWPVSKMLIHLNPKISYLQLNIESFCFAVLFALFSWYIVEKPFISLKGKKTKQIA